MPLNASGTGPPTVLFAGIHGFAPFADTLRAIGPPFEALLTAVQPLEILRVPNSHIGFFEHPHMADLVQVLNPRLRR